MPLALKYKLLFALLILSIPLLFLLDLFLGSVSIPANEILTALGGKEIDRAYEIILFQSRIPKALTAILAGASLSLAGLMMQTLFRNPLAGPYVLGLSSGAGLGVALLVMGAGLFGFGLHPDFSLPMASMLGSLGILLILFAVSIKVKDIMTLLILGIMLGSIATAIIGLIQYLTTDAQLKSFLIWTLGSLEGISYANLKLMAWVLGLTGLVSFFMAKILNAFLLGDHYAQSLGLKLHSSRLIIILIAGCTAGIVTAFCGPIGFVGVIIPHLSRLLFQSSDHKILIPSSLLMGASVLLLSDVISSLPQNGIVLPINSITSIIGIPIILWIIFNKRTISSGF